MKYATAIVFVIAATIVLAACNPYEYNMGSKHIIRCNVMTGLPSVSQGHTITTLHDTGSIDMNYYGATQYLLAMDVRLKRGDGFRVLLRPVVEQRDVKDSGIVLLFTRSGVWLWQKDKNGTMREDVARTDVRLPANEYLPISFLSENNYTQVVLGCDTVYKGWSKKMESDDVVIQTLDQSEVEIAEPDWAGLPDR